MVDKIPVKAVFTGAVVTALAEFGATDTVPIAQGGTGAITAAAARTGLGATPVGDAVFIAATASAARTALDLKQLQPIDYTLAANALTLKLNPTNLDFRSTTLTSGAPVNVSNAAQLTLTIPSTATLGTVSGVQSELVEIAINNAGVMEVAVVNLAGGVNLDETGIISTTALSATSNSNNVIYSTTARTGVAYRVVGLFRSTQTVAGTWAQAPTLLQPVGGQALAAMSSFGFGQTRQNLTGSRALATTYYNTTGKPIWVSVTGWNTAGTGANYIQHTVGGVVGPNLTSSAPASNYTVATCFVVLPGQAYTCSMSGGGTTVALLNWEEIR